MVFASTGIFILRRFDTILTFSSEGKRPAASSALFIRKDSCPADSRGFILILDDVFSSTRNVILCPGVSSVFSLILALIFEPSLSIIEACSPFIPIIFPENVWPASMFLSKERPLLSDDTFLSPDISLFMFSISEEFT